MTDSTTSPSSTNQREPILLEGIRLQNGYILDATLSAEVHVFLADGQQSAAEAPLQELCAVLSGWAAPRRGRVRIGQVSPHNHPPIRRRIASVLGVEPPLVGRTVGEHVERLERALGRSVRTEHTWLERWWSRSSASLTNRERRSIAAAVAFSDPEPLLAVIYEPGRLGPAFEPHDVLSRIGRWQQAGVTVACATTDHRVATQLGVRAWLVSPRKPAAQPAAEYLVRSSSSRALAARLAEHPAVLALRYEETLPRDLWVRGADIDSLAEVIRAAVLTEGCELYELTRLHRSSGNEMQESTP